MFIFIMLLCCGLYAQKEEVIINTDYEMPTFEDNSAQLIDMSTFDGKFCSFVRITNYSKYKSIEFEVFVHSPLSSSWESLGTASLPGFDADADYGKKYPNLNQYRYFAILPKSDSKSGYLYKIEKKGGRLDVQVFTKGDNVNEKPLPYHDSPGVYVFTDRLIPGGAKENIRLQNMTSQLSISVVVFGWDKKHFKWIQLCSISAQAGQKKPTVYEVFDKKLSFKKFKYLALATPDGKKYNYKFRESHDDWLIIIEDSL